jgi:16S rRNA (guanine527-N7)-methyltransferase
MDRSEAMTRYVEILLDRGVSWGLIGPREADRVWQRHIDNSLALSTLIPGDAVVVDVGSGAGLPGIPLALARPDLRVTLLEPMLRRTTFLSGVIEELDLEPRVSVVRGRAEEHRERYDVVVARALAPLDRLLGWCLPLLRAKGILLALKGRSAADELPAAEPILRSARRQADILEVQASPDAEPTTVVRVR